MKKHQTFTAEFKREAVRLLEQSDKLSTETALNLGIRRNQLYKWRDELNKKGDAAFEGSGRNPKDQESEMARLKQELVEVKEEHDILKKAAQSVWSIRPPPNDPEHEPQKNYSNNTVVESSFNNFGVVFSSLFIEGCSTISARTGFNSITV